MTLTQTAVVHAASAGRESPNAIAAQRPRPIDTARITRRERSTRTARAREARLRLNSARDRGDFSHLGRVFD
jgi:hypothetical protein